MMKIIQLKSTVQKSLVQMIKYLVKENLMYKEKAQTLHKKLPFQKLKNLCLVFLNLIRQ